MSVSLLCITDICQLHGEAKGAKIPEWWYDPDDDRIGVTVVTVPVTVTVAVALFI